MKKSGKQISLEKKLLTGVAGKARLTLELLIGDEEIQHLQDYANTVSIKRLGYNDHGPVHMRTVAKNCIEILNILNGQGIALNLQTEGIGTFEDSTIAVIMAAFLHDIGMTVSRSGHENSSIFLSMPIIERILSKVYAGNRKMQVILRSLILECISGHMATNPVFSLEAGVLLVGDGCDMEKGRARIPMLFNKESRVGDIHKYSADAIDRVSFQPGEKRPLRINVEMNSSVGLFQVEEVLMAKINSSPLRQHIGLYAYVRGEERKQYL